MASPFDYTVSSFVISNVRSDDSEYEYEYNDEADEEEEILSESLDQTDMDTNAIDANSESDVLSLSILETGDLDAQEDPDDITTEYVDLDTDPDEGPVEHQSKRIKLSNEGESEDNEVVDPNQKCPICLASWTNVGDHRLCSLRCGHLFGYKCIKHWLNSKKFSARKCPQCNSKASAKHIRLIYANQLTVHDNRVVDKMKKELEESNKKIAEISKALAKEKKRTKKYKQLYKAKTLALTADSDFEFFE